MAVWDSGSGKDGGCSTANFLSRMYKSAPLLQGVFNMAGIELPSYLKRLNIP